MSQNNEEVQYEYVEEVVYVDDYGDENVISMDDNNSDGNHMDDDNDNEIEQYDEETTDVMPIEGIKRETSFLVLEGKQLVEEQQKELGQIQDTLNVPISVAAALMRYFKWNKEQLLTQCIDNPEGVIKKAGIELHSKTFTKGKAGEKFTCPICDDVVDGTKAASLKCKHWFCSNCWREFLHVKIDEGASCLGSTCPAPNCKSAVDESVFKEFCTQPYYKKYEGYCARSFVEDNPHIRWCPAPNCGRAIHLFNANRTIVKCACTHTFCFRCGNEPHDPCTCAELKKWISKEQSESETAKWLAVNTKECPRCKVTIYKYEGCNHMTCKGCKHEFCWMCFGDWKDHGANTGGFYQCNKYRPDESSEKNKEDARRELDKYIHYYTRYANHDASRKFEQPLRQKAEKKMAELQSKNKYSAWIDVEYIQKGVEQLIQCRSVLKYTYVFAYYLQTGREKNLFEFLQEELEKTTEYLSETLEKKLDEMGRDQVVNITRLAEQRLNHLLEGVRNGLTS